MTTSKKNDSRLPEDAIQRFRESFYLPSNSECWIWKTATPNRYSRFSYIDAVTKKQMERSGHAVSFYVHNGRWPTEGTVLMHSCDNIHCVNPDHIREGTPLENSQDMVAKGRQAKGTSCHTNKLSEEQVKQIHQKYKNGSSIPSLSGEFQVTSGSIYFIVTGKTWKHLNLQNIYRNQ